mgnify:CR=1 FL=1
MNSVEHPEHGGVIGGRDEDRRVEFAHRKGEDRDPRPHEGRPDAGTDDAEESAFPAWPDVILIDGGQGQMSAVRSILEDLGIADRIVAIGVAKGQAEMLLTCGLPYSPRRN